MFDNKNKKKKPIAKIKSKSTFERMMDIERTNQEKKLKALFGSSKKLFDALNVVQRIEVQKRLFGFPSEQEIDSARRIAEIPPNVIENFSTMIETLPEHIFEGIFANSEIIVNLESMLENILKIEKQELKKLEGMVVNLPLEDIQRSLDQTTTLSIEIKETKPLNDLRNNFLLSTKTEESIEIGKIQLRTIQETHMHVQNLQLEVKDIKETLTEDAKKKDEMLEELLKFARTGGKNLVRIKKVKYNKKSCELIIDNKIINIQADTHQHYLCKILFNSKASIKTDWEIYDIVEAFGEDTDMLREWQEIIYYTVRHLNQKIQSVTGLKKFILYSNKKVIVNPNYIDLS